MIVEAVLTEELQFFFVFKGSFRNSQNDLPKALVIQVWRPVGKHQDCCRLKCAVNEYLHSSCALHETKTLQKVKDLLWWQMFPVCAAHFTASLPPREQCLQSLGLKTGDCSNLPKQSQDAETVSLYAISLVLVTQQLLTNQTQNTHFSLGLCDWGLTLQKDVCIIKRLQFVTNNVWLIHR